MGRLSQPSEYRDEIPSIFSVECLFSCHRAPLSRRRQAYAASVRLLPSPSATRPMTPTIAARPLWHTTILKVYTWRLKEASVAVRKIAIGTLLLQIYNPNYGHVNLTVRRTYIFKKGSLILTSTLRM